MSTLARRSWTAALSGLRHEPTDKRIRAFVGDGKVVDSSRALLVWEPRRVVSSYAVPVADVAGELRPSRPTVPAGADAGLPLAAVSDRPVLDPSIPFSVHTAEGAVVDVVVGEHVLPAAGLTLDDPDLTGYVVLDFAAFTRWQEEDDDVLGHPREPFHRIEVLDSSRHVRLELEGEVLAESTGFRILFESLLPARFYLPREDVRAELLPSPTTTTCAYKGHATYYSPVVADRPVADLAWSYLSTPARGGAGSGHGRLLRRERGRRAGRRTSRAPAHPVVTSAEGLARLSRAAPARPRRRRGRAARRTATTAGSGWTSRCENPAPATPLPTRRCRGGRAGSRARTGSPGCSRPTRRRRPASPAVARSRLGEQLEGTFGVSRRLGHQREPVCGDALPARVGELARPGERLLQQLGRTVDVAAGQLHLAAQRLRPRQVGEPVLALDQPVGLVQLRRGGVQVAAQQAEPTQEGQRSASRRGSPATRESSTALSSSSTGARVASRGRCAPTPRYVVAFASVVGESSASWTALGQPAARRARTWPRRKST